MYLNVLLIEPLDATSLSLCKPPISQYWPFQFHLYAQTFKPKQLHSTVPRNLIKTDIIPRSTIVNVIIRYRSKPLYVFLYLTYQKMTRHEATCEGNHHDILICLYIQIGIMSSCQNHHRKSGSIPAIIVPSRSTRVVDLDLDQEYACNHMFMFMLTLTDGMSSGVCTSAPSFIGIPATHVLLIFVSSPITQSAAFTCTPIS